MVAEPPLLLLLEPEELGAGFPVELLLELEPHAAMASVALKPSTSVTIRRFLKVISFTWCPWECLSNWTGRC